MRTTLLAAVGLLMIVSYLLTIAMSQACAMPEAVRDFATAGIAVLGFAVIYAANRLIDAIVAVNAEEPCTR